MHHLARSSRVALVVALAAAIVLAVASPAGASVFENGKRWPSSSRPGGGDGLVQIPVCLVSGSDTTRTVGDPSIVPHAPNPTLDQVLAQIRDALHQAWELDSPIRFIGWHWCDALSDTERGEAVGFYVSSSATNDAKVGTDAKGRTSADAPGVEISPWGPAYDTRQCIQWNVLNFRYEYRFSCAREFAVHEFGHVLGFDHEWQNPAKPDSCKPNAGEDPVPAGSYSTTFDPGKTYTIVNPADFDWDSVMTYGTDCAHVTGERFGSPSPSETDLKGLHEVYPYGHDVGVLSGGPSPGCGSAERVEFVLDDENDASTSAANGWTGESHIGPVGPVLDFCRADGSRFKAAARPYAVLKLGTRCPAGSAQAARVFDSEDDTMASSVSDADAAWPNGVPINGKPSAPQGATRDVVMFLCVFPGVGGSGPPDLGYAYGVLAPADFPGALATGTLHIDDENDDNQNLLSLSPDVSGISALLDAGADTTLHMVSIVGAGPSISSIDDQTIDEDQPTDPIPFTVDDPDTPADQLVVTASSDDAPRSGVVDTLRLAGAGRDRTLTVVPQQDASGSSTITVTVSDGVNRTSTQFHLTVRPVNDPPRVSLEPVDPVDEGSTVTVHAHGSDPDSSPLAYAWWWDDSYANIGPEHASASFTADDGPADHVVTVQVSDEGPTWTAATASETIHVRNVAPSVQADAVAAAPWGVPMSFDGTVTDPSSADTTAGFTTRWTFGDGDDSDALRRDHAYARPGSYEARLSATDKDGGTGSDTRQVTVGKRASSLAYTGPASAPFGFAGLSARRGDEVDANTAVLAGDDLTFSVDGQTLHATTAADGSATAVPSPPLLPGAHHVDVSFAGNALYEPSSASGTVTVVNSPGTVMGEIHPSSGGILHVSARYRDGQFRGELRLQRDGEIVATTQLEGLGISSDGHGAWVAGTDPSGHSLVAYVEDNSSNGRADVFTLTRDGVVVAQGPIGPGNVHVRAGDPGPSTG